MGIRPRPIFLPKILGLILVAVLTAAPGFAQKSRKPLSKAEVLELLQNGVPSTRVDDLVRAYGVDFEITPQDALDIKDAGASDDLIKTLKEISPKHEPPAAPKSDQPPAQAPAAPTPEPPVLMIESTPGGAEVYVDEERVGKTSPEGKLKISTLKPGEHRVRLSATGFDDLTRTIELAAGQSNVVAVALAPKKPTETEPSANPQSSGRPAAQMSGGTALGAIIGAMAGEGAGDPNVKRFMVTHDHGKSVMGYGGGLCSGWLIIGNDRVQFSSNNENDAFDVTATDITQLQIKSNHIRFRIKNRKYHLMTQDMGIFGGDSQGPGAVRLAFESVGLKSSSK